MVPIPAGLGLDVPLAEFGLQWLHSLCLAIPGVEAALLSIHAAEGEPVLAAWPASVRDREDMLGVAAQAREGGRDVVVYGRGHGPSSRPALLLGCPLLHGTVTVLELSREAAGDMPSIFARLRWGSGWIESLAGRARNQELQRASDRIASGLDLVAVAGEHGRLTSAAMALANELLVSTGANRVFIGVSNGDRVRLSAISHSADFERRSRLVGLVEQAMDEAVDQDAAIVLPILPDRGGRIDIAHAALLKEIERGSVLTVPLRGRRGFAGAVLLERDRRFEKVDVAFLEGVASALGSVLQDKAAAERWVGGRAAEAVADGLAALIGRHHVVAKLSALAAIAAVVFLALATGDHRVSAKAVLEGSVQRAAVAPFDGFIASAPARAGDVVVQGQVLATFDDKDLTLERLRVTSERDKLAQKYRETLSKRDRPGMGVLVAQIKQAEAQLALVEEKLSRTRITSPIAGLLVSGDLSQMLGSPVERGKVLFELAPLDDYRVVLHVNERDVRYVAVGQEGTVALSGTPDAALPLIVTKIMPVTAVEDGANTFRVEAALKESDSRARPGMEGVGKITVGHARLIWIWTRSFVDWVRLAAWKWLP